MNTKKCKYIQIKEEGKFKLFVKCPIYKEYKVNYPFVIKNKKTNEILQDTELRLFKIWYDDKGNLLDEPIYEEDCYELIRIDE